MTKAPEYIGLDGEPITCYGYKVHIAVDNSSTNSETGPYAKELNELLGSYKSLCGNFNCDFIIRSYDKNSLAPLTKFDITKVTCERCLKIHKKWENSGGIKMSNDAYVVLINKNKTLEIGWDKADVYQKIGRFCLTKPYNGLSSAHDHDWVVLDLKDKEKIAEFTKKEYALGYLDYIIKKGRALEGFNGSEKEEKRRIKVENNSSKSSRLP